MCALSSNNQTLSITKNIPHTQPAHDGFNNSSRSPVPNEDFTSSDSGLSICVLITSDFGHNGESHAACSVHSLISELEMGVIIMGVFIPV